MKTKSLFFDNKKIVYYTKGASKKSVMFCHGACQNHTAGLNLLELFPEDYTRLAIDFPGHGLSESIPDNSFERESNLIRKILEKESIKKIIFIGHSKGAEICSIFTINNLDFVQSLVLINPFFIEPKKIFWYLPEKALIWLYLKSAAKKYNPVEDFLRYGNELTEEEIRQIGFQYTPFESIKQNLELYDDYDIRKPIQKLCIPILILKNIMT